ncbi:MAG: potassium channel family protein [Blastomonas fulva]|jgi:voltage-gated potassium channel|uniref:potassium channel family protein n=1 Tax=Blastomonas TaxID=150203 RepID=UPI00083D0A05|nr:MULTISPECIES: potassium channel family protein [unclassified Blastomonas]AOG02331.1 trkA-N domain protein [Blastomonas sp. RAC04]
MADSDIKPRALLKRAARLPVLADVALRLGFAFFLIALVILIHWLDRAGLKDNFDNEISFLDVVYFTMISVTTTGFGDIAPVSDRSRLIESVVVTPVRVAVIFIFVGTAYSFVLKRTWEKWQMSRIQQRLTGHIVVLGFGTSGSEAVRELIARGTEPGCIVVIDQHEPSLARAEAMGCNVLNADAARDETLRDVHIDRACSAIVSAGRDDTSILIVLTIRHLAPDVPISVVVRAADNELLARQAGANTVINPVSFAGLLLAGSCQGPHISSYLADLASSSGRVVLIERMVRPEEVGLPLKDIKDGVGVRIYRDGKPYGFWDDESASLSAGDLVVVITQGDGRPPVTMAND